jgi:hypothetical protein
LAILPFPLLAPLRVDPHADARRLLYRLEAGPLAGWAFAFGWKLAGESGSCGLSWDRPIGVGAGLARHARSRTVVLKKRPAIGDGCQSREVTLRNVIRFAGALCVANHTRTGQFFEPP